MDVCVEGQPGLQVELQDSQGYTEKSCLKKANKESKSNQTKEKQKANELNVEHHHSWVLFPACKHSEPSSLTLLLPASTS
jgi:hypothetical protein